jgi:hypothetical protein
MRLLYYIRRFYEIPASEKFILFKGILLCFLANLCVYTLPLKLYINMLQLKPKFNLSEESVQGSVILIRKTLKRIDNIWPWKNSCLVKSIVFKKLITYLGVECKISLGVKMNNNILTAHAYVKIMNNDNFLGALNMKELITL